MKPEAKIICDSISPDGVRLTTMQVTMHRFVLAEFNTHRVFSRNSASSRAIPYSKQKEKVEKNLAFPIYWGAEQKGMQSGENLESYQIGDCEQTWSNAAKWAVYQADVLKGLGLHKSIINRLLEPFLWHMVVVSATEWDNFFWQRCSSLAQPEMKAAADAMQLAYYASEPTYRRYGEWHLPYINDFTIQAIQDIWVYCKGDPSLSILEIAKQVSVARCARVSYETQEGKLDINADVGLFERLKNADPMHASPFEHVATPIKIDDFAGKNLKSNWGGNFYGWRQFRQEFPNENKLKFVPNLPELQHLVESNDE